MSEEIGIVMSLYDKVSPVLKSIGSNTKAFDKDLQGLEQSCKSYEKSQESLVKDISALKSKLTESNQKVKKATKVWKAGKGEQVSLGGKFPNDSGFGSSAPENIYRRS